MGKSVCAVCVMDENGGVLYETKYPNIQAAAGELTRIVLGKHDCRAVCESAGNLWIKMYEELEGHGIPISLANSIRPKMSRLGTKTDRLHWALGIGNYETPLMAFYNKTATDEARGRIPSGRRLTSMADGQGEAQHNF